MAYSDVIVHSGNAPDTTLASDISAGSTSLTLTSGTGYPSPTGGQISFLTLAPGTTAEEKVYYTARSGTGCTGVTRAQDGTSAAAHTAGVTIRHGWTGGEADSAMAAVLNTLGRVTATGDILVADSATTLAKLAKGTAYQNLAMNSGATTLGYQASIQSLMTTQGDIVQASAANTPARLAIGTARQVPAVNSGATALEYVASLQSLMTTTGDMVQASAANTPARVAAGTAGYVWTAGGAGVASAWAAPAGGTLNYFTLSKTAQSISNTTLTKIVFDTEVIDKNTNIAVPITDIIIPSGVWLVLFQSNFAANATGYRYIDVTGCLMPGAQAAPATPADSHYQTTTGLFVSTGANSFACTVYQTSGGSLNTTATLTCTRLGTATT